MYRKAGIGSNFQLTKQQIHADSFKTMQVTLGQLAKEVEEEEAQQSGGAVDFSHRRNSSLESLQKVPGYELRPGAPKMQLRPEEEELLPLVRHSWWKTVHAFDHLCVVVTSAAVLRCTRSLAGQPTVWRVTSS